MATIKLRIYVNELSNVMTQFDQIKVYRSDLEAGVYVEITGVPTRIILVAGIPLYEYIDATAPDDTYWYKTAYYHSVSTAESSLSEALQGSDIGLYVSIQDIRDEGITAAELTDARALLLIMQWQEWFDKATGQFFVPVAGAVDFDGDGTRLLLLPYPIITCDNLFINDNFTTAIDTNNYTVYNGRSRLQDDRKNPHIELKRSTPSSTIFTQSLNRIFEIGDRNQRVEGTFGYVEADGSVPAAVQGAVKILVIATKDMLADDQIDQLIGGRIIEEVTDRHRVEYADLYNRLKAWNPTGITSVDLALRMYRGPTQVTAPRTMMHPVV